MFYFEEIFCFSNIIKIYFWGIFYESCHTSWWSWNENQ
jgi:hypothetical protein